MPSTNERLDRLAASARDTPKGRAITINLYTYPSGAGAIGISGASGVGANLMTNSDEETLQFVESILTRVRSSK